MKQKNDLSPQKTDLITIDWLSISIQTVQQYYIKDENQRIKFGKTIELIPTHKKTPNFRCIWDVIYKGEHVAELQTCPNKDNMEENHAILKFQNELFYTYSLKKIYNDLKFCISWSFIKVNQIDIAVDREERRGIDTFMKKYVQGKIDFVGNQEVTATFKNSTTLKYFRVGSRKSDKFMRIYWKRQELEVSNKRYISEWWEKNGIDSEKEVLRTELSLKGSLMNKIIMPDIDDDSGETFTPFENEHIISIIQDPRILKDIFISETKKFCKYVKTSELKKKKRTNICKQYNVFDFNIKESIWKFSRIKQNYSKIIHKVKIVSKFLQELAIETECNIYEIFSDEVAKFGGLREWKNDKVERWEHELKKKLENPNYRNFISMFSDLTYKVV